ncbi:MAG TPA: hypothetical protein VJO14_00135, partial [Bacteroidota bacterium]|nr:hypothetical protein [Bacteroidota bacterium]
MGKISYLIAVVLAVSVSAPAQKRYLVSPDQEIIPLEPGSAGSSFIRELRNLDRSATPAYCGDGYIIDPPPLNVSFNARHKDVMGQWYIAPAAGTIDTIFWTTGQIGDWLSDSTAFVRVHRSNINPLYGPGVRPGPFNPPCQPWGYWINTNDLDMGITAFPELATDTTWISTYPGPGIPSTPPIGENIWGTSSGYPVRLKSDALNMVVVDDLAPLTVAAGDVFFISVELSYRDPVLPVVEIPTWFYASQWTVTTSDGDYPSRNWKFYEHDKGPSSCASLPIDSMKRGWFARGSGTGDSLDVMEWDMWYTMTVDGNAPPFIEDYSHLGNTFSPADRLLQAVIEDCYALNPPDAGVASAAIVYEVDGEQQIPVTMSYLGADTWEGIIPGQSPGTRVTARVEALDFDANTGVGPSFSYTIVPFGNEWYAIDTGYACAPN